MPAAEAQAEAVADGVVVVPDGDLDALNR